jgi:hypothetical protein
MIWAGAVLTCVFVLAAIFLDRAARPGTVLSSAAAFMWDLGKGTLLGTAVISVVDDVRTWGRGWRSIQASATRLKGASTQFTREVDKITCEREEPFAGGLHYVAYNAYTASRRLGAISDAHSDHIDERLGAGLDQDAGQHKSPFADWASFEKALQQGGFLPPLRDDMRGRSPASGADAIREAAKAMADVLHSLRGDVSTIAAGSIQTLVEHLSAAGDNGGLLIDQFGRLADGDAADAKIATSALLGLRASVTSLEFTLLLLIYEGETGFPHPSRGGRYL